MSDPVAEPAPHKEAAAPAVTEPGPAPAADTLVAPPSNGEEREEPLPLAPDPPSAPAGPEPEPEPAPPSTTLSLEERVRRLEDALAALHVLPPPTPTPGQKTHVTPGSPALLLGPLSKVAGLDPSAVPAPPVREAVPGPPPLPPRPPRWLLGEIL